MGVKYLRFILLLVFFSAAYRYPCGLSEEIDVDNYEMKGLSAASEFNIMDELSLLYNDIHIGPVGIKPSYQVNEIYDDNVYDAAEEEVSDLYTLHRPSLLIAAPFSDYLLSHFKYDVEIYDYEHEQERDRVNQSWEGSLGFYFANDFSFVFSDRFRKHVIPPGFQRRSFGDIDDLDIPFEDQGPNVFVGRRDLTTNIASFEMDFPDFFPNVDFLIRYNNQDVSYQKDEFKSDDYNLDTLGAIIEYNYPLLPVKVSSGFVYSIQRYDAETSKNRDNYKNDIPLNISWTINQKNEIYLNTNYRTSKYKKHSNIENFEGWNVVLGDRYLINPVSSVEIYGERSLKEQRQANNNSYFYTKVGIKYINQHDRIDGYLDVYYWNMRFAESTGTSGVVEDVDSFHVHLNVKYRPQKWWFAEFDYSYANRDNTFDSGDLLKNAVSLGLGLTF